jgi:uncharacterized membrane protein YqjE
VADNHSDEIPPPGLLDSARALLATLVQLLHTRVELFTTEIEEEMHRIARLLLWGTVAIFCGGLCVLMLSLTVVIVFWDDHRVFAAVAMTTLFLTIVLAAVLQLRAVLREHPRLLAASRDELRRDRDGLEGNTVERP